MQQGLLIFLLAPSSGPARLRLQVVRTDGESNSRQRMPRDAGYAVGDAGMTVAAMVWLYHAQYLGFGALIWVLDAPKVMYA